MTDIDTMQDRNDPEWQALASRFWRIDPENVARQRTSRATSAWDRWRAENGRSAPHPRYRRSAK